MLDNNIISDSQIEEIAKSVHKAWMKEKISHGWRRGAEYNSNKKIHPSICPYEDLSEEEKDMDRSTAAAVLNALTNMGYTIKGKNQDELF